METIFKESKHQPIKFRNFKFISYHPDYPAAYYYKKLPRDNYEFMECILEGYKKPEMGAGTSIKVIDTFMTNYIKNHKSKKPIELGKPFIESVIENSYYDLEEKTKESMLEKFTSKVPNEIKKDSKLYKKYEKDFEILYCSNDESKDRKMGIVNIVFVREEHLKSEDKRISIDRHFTVFKPLRFRVAPAYLTKKSTTKYLEEEFPQIVICHDLLK